MMLRMICGLLKLLNRCEVAIHLCAILIGIIRIGTSVRIKFKGILFVHCADTQLRELGEYKSSLCRCANHGPTEYFTQDAQDASGR